MLLFAALISSIIAAQACVGAEPVKPPESVGVSIEKFTISRDDSVYECFPSLTRCDNGRIVLVYRESDGHKVKTFCRLIVRVSDDGGKTFSDRQVLVDAKHADGHIDQYNCPKVQQLKDGRVLITCDRFCVPPGENGDDCRASHVLFWFSSDHAQTWSKPVDSGVLGIMPDEVVELPDGAWLLATQFVNPGTVDLHQCAHRSADGGKTWGEAIVVASKKGYKFCEASIVRVPGGELVCYVRENSGKGRPIYKCISADGGLSWKGPYATQMDSGHRPVAHLTKSGKVLVTYRYQIGGASPWAKNTFAYIESTASAIETNRQKQNGIVLPLDHDRNHKSDGGYTGWVETAPGEFLMVNYIKDDAPKAQIRGCRFSENDF